MAFEFGGMTPQPDHHKITLKAPASGVSETTPIAQWEPLSYTGYQAARVADGGTPEAVATARVNQAGYPVGALLIGGKHTVITVSYTGTAPSVGNSLVSNGAGAYRIPSTGETGAGEVLKVDTANKTVDWLI